MEFAGLPFRPLSIFGSTAQSNDSNARRYGRRVGEAIVALDGDIGRRVQGTPAVDVYHPDIEQLRQEKAALSSFRSEPDGADVQDRRPS